MKTRTYWHVLLVNMLVAICVSFRNVMTSYFVWMTLSFNFIYGQVPSSSKVAFKEMGSQYWTFYLSKSAGSWLSWKKQKSRPNRKCTVRVKKGILYKGSDTCNQGLEKWYSVLIHASPVWVAVLNWALQTLLDLDFMLSLLLLCVV